MKDDSIEDADDLPEPEELVTAVIEEMQGAMKELGEINALLEDRNGSKHR